MLQGEHSAIHSIFIKLPFVIKIFVLSIFEWPFYIGFKCQHIFLDKSDMKIAVFLFHKKWGNTQDNGTFTLSIQMDSSLV